MFISIANSKYFVIAFFFTLVGAFSNTCFVFSRDITIPKEAVDAWKSMADEISTVQYTIRYKSKTEKLENQYKFSIQGNLKKCEIAQIDKDERSEKAYIQNMRGFVLGKGDAGKWRLMSISDPGEQIGRLSNAHYLSKAGLSLHGSANLLDIPNNERFTVEKWRVLENRDNQVEFRVRDNTLKATFTLLLQPEKRYRVVEWSGQDDHSPKAARKTFTYADDSVYGEVVPLRVVARDGDLSWELISLAHETLPEEEFRLSFYGLPDYVEPPTARNYWIWMFMVAVIVTLVVFWKTRRAT